MESPKERRERRRAAKRHAIRMAAVRIALDQGLEAATVEAISAAADISPRTFFNYFASKDDALVMQSPVSPDEMIEALEQRPLDEPVLRSLRIIAKARAEIFMPVFAGMEQFQELLRRHPELASRTAVTNQQKVMERVVDVIERRLGDGDRLRARLVMIGTFGATFSAVLEFLAGTTEGSIDELLDRAFDLLEGGLSA
ncbi:TetR/AcrR family transcriptional regulator [Nonomuraea sp. NPDC050536]|uniref:TetR/AcrR family transcriptional regulator n=1 Tax=Nonomuraea sp. NPDC050536 TaxID=3364366 RepID=UPI0037C97512